MKKVLILTSLFYLLSSSILAQNSVIQDSLESIESEYVLELYKQLISHDEEIEYGWICQSIVPVIPKQREAILSLIRLNRFDLIRTLLEAPRIESQLYALDALIYQKVKNKNLIGAELNSKINQLKKNNLRVITCPDFIGDWWDSPIFVRTIFYSMTHNERVESIDYLLNEPFKIKSRKPNGIEIPNVSGDY